jgi:hypothetical protein
VDYRGGYCEVKEWNEIWEGQEFAEEEGEEGDVHGIAGDGEDAGGDELVGAVFIDADAETFAEGAKAPQDQGGGEAAEEDA